MRFWRRTGRHRTLPGVSAVSYPMNTIRAALLGSLDALAFSLDLVPKALLVEPVIPGHRWGVTMQLAHLAVYEDRIAATGAGSHGERERWPAGCAFRFGGLASSDARLLSREAPSYIVGVLRSARERQRAAVDRFSEEAFHQPLTSLWGGLQPAGRVAAKTVRHTWEHGTPIIQTALFAPR